MTITETQQNKLLEMLYEEIEKDFDEIGKYISQLRDTEAEKVPVELERQQLADTLERLMNMPLLFFYLFVDKGTTTSPVGVNAAPTYKLPKLPKCTKGIGVKNETF